MHGPSFGTLSRRGTIALCAATLLLAACGKHEPPAGGGNGSGNGSGNGNGNPLQPGTDQDVHVKWKTDHWEISLNGKPDVLPKDAKTDLIGVGPTKFTVRITGKNVTYADNPLTVWTGDKEHPKAGIEGTQILGPIIDKHDKLVFFDLNQGEAVRLYYAIHFKNGDPDVDPIIDNGGTNTK